MQDLDQQPYVTAVATCISKPYTKDPIRASDYHPNRALRYRMRNRKEYRYECLFCTCVLIDESARTETYLEVVNTGPEQPKGLSF